MADPIVTIKQGKIKGTTDTDLDGGSFYKFLGIPYAKPPVGALRFKAPEAPESWDGLLDCRKDERNAGCLCFQNLSKEYIGSEDCLYLNVFTQQLPNAGLTLKPVMVFIHGGGFTLGSGSETLHGPNHLLTEDIVLVTFSYRTGIFGFLSTDDPSLDVPGNAGLKDQTFALKWVQENISKFNGDANNVTIFGVSAGGASVSFQVLSPTAKGLFHKAIAQSGFTLNPWVWGQKNSIQVAHHLGLEASTEKEALDIIIDTPARELLEAALKIPDYIAGKDRRPYGPVIEKPNSTAFLTENPLDLLASGRYNQVPMIQGVVSNEGMLFDSPHSEQPSSVSGENGVLWYWDLESNTEKAEKITKLVDDFYFQNGTTKAAIYDFYGDSGFMYGAVESSKIISKTSIHPIYLYVYSREVDLSNLTRTIFRIQDPTIKGVAHGGDQMVLFSCFLSQLLQIKTTGENKEAVKQLVKLWTDFARTGKPHEKWEPVNNEGNVNYFDIDKELTLKSNPFAQRFEFWDKIFKECPSINASLNERTKLL